MPIVLEFWFLILTIFEVIFAVFKSLALGRQLFGTRRNEVTYIEKGDESRLITIYSK